MASELRNRESQHHAVFIKMFRKHTHTHIRFMALWTLYVSVNDLIYILRMAVVAELID